MLPFFVPLWETEATLRAAVEQSAQASVTSLGAGAVLLGADLSFDARAARPRAEYLAAAHAEYLHAFDVAIGGGAGPPSYNLAADTSLSAAWTLGPKSSLTLDTEGSLATTYGIHADSQLLALDPFLFAQRLEYAFGHTLGFTIGHSARASFSVEAGYVQTGALWSEPIPGLPAGDAAATGTGAPTTTTTTTTTQNPVGVDTHEGHVSVSSSYDLGPRDSLSPEIRLDFAHYEHALLDVHFHRGPADVRTGTLSLSATHEIARGLTIKGTAGVSAGDAMPAVHAGAPVLAPDAGLSLRWTGRRARLTAKADYAYTSLGPRLGYGQQLRGTLKLDVRPRDGVRWRDLLLHGTLRFAHGAAPVGADPQPALPGMPALPATGTVTTTTLMAGTRVEIPLARGLAFTTGGEAAWARGAVGGPGAAGTVGTELLATVTVGLALTVSTDKRRTVPRDPEAEAEEEGRKAGGDGREGPREHQAPGD